jgi:hypothetical protein
VLQSLKYKGRIVGAIRKTVKRFGNINPLQAGVRTQIPPVIRPAVAVGPSAEIRLDRIEVNVTRAVQKVVPDNSTPAEAKTKFSRPDTEPADYCRVAAMNCCNSNPHQHSGGI